MILFLSLENDAGVSGTVRDLAEDLVTVGPQGATHVWHPLLHNFSQ